MSSKEVTKSEIPDVLKDPTNGRVYQRGKFLGKGGFAKCYELTDVATQKIFAGKIVSKTLLVKPHQKEKMSQEISIHSKVKHKHVVGFISFFEDTNNVYIILELCRKRSLMELHKRRKAVTEPEARFFLLQLCNGVKHLHDSNIIHRDLKLGNLFLNDDMELKIGDFGLATIYEGKRRKTVCGTPNYIAPEVITKKGHGYEADIWSIGCILYTLLVGKPPFETNNLSDTYQKIRKNEYHIPSRITGDARTLITKLLQDDPTRRPDVDQILTDPFITNGYVPKRLPVSCLTTAPRYGFTDRMNAMRKPLSEINPKYGSPMKNYYPPRKDGAPDPSTATAKKTTNPAQNLDDQPEDCYLKELYNQIDNVVSSKPDEREKINQDEAEDPKAVPLIWVSKWVDYSDKYGLGYQFSDDSIGVFYNDLTKLMLLPDGESMHYIDRSGNEFYHTIKKYPENLDKKVTLLRYFNNYMKEHLIKAAATMCPRESEIMTRVHCLRTYFRTRSAIVIHISNGTLQINFFEDHTKIILCPLMEAVTYIDKEKNFKTYKLSGLKEHGCSTDLANRLRYAKNMIYNLLLKKSSSSKASEQQEPSSSKTATITNAQKV